MIYETLIDRRDSFIGPRHWLGNLRWVAEEMDAAGYFVFRTAPINTGEDATHVTGMAYNAVNVLELVRLMQADSD